MPWYYNYKQQYLLKQKTMRWPGNVFLYLIFILKWHQSGVYSHQCFTKVNKKLMHAKHVHFKYQVNVGPIPLFKVKRKIPSDETSSLEMTSLKAFQMFCISGRLYLGTISKCNNYITIINWYVPWHMFQWNINMFLSSESEVQCDNLRRTFDTTN